MPKRNANGTYDVKNEKQAKEALRAMIELKHEVARLQEEHGITEMMDDSTELKKAATRWAVEQNQEAIDIGGGVYARLRRDKYGGTWIATDDDLDGAPGTSLSLRRILRVKFKGDKAALTEIWNRVTKRTVDPDKLNRVVEEGLLSAEEIAPAFYEKEKQPFLMIYGS